MKAGDARKGTAAAVGAAFLAGIADRLLDTIALGILIGAGLVLTGTALGEEGLGTALTAAAALMIVVVGIVLWAGRRRLASCPRRLRRLIAQALSPLRQLTMHPGPALFALLLALTMQGSFVLLNVWIGRSLDIGLPVAVWLVVWPLAKCAGLLPISLGGLGVRDAAFGAMLVPLRVPMAHGVVAHLVWQTALVIGGLFAGATWWLLSYRSQPGVPTDWRSLVREAGATRG